MSEDKFKGYICKCCGLFVKCYRRSMNSNMAVALLTLYKYGKGQYVHMEQLLQSKGLKRCGDFSYLRFFGLIERFEGKRSDGSNRNGQYRITGRGIAFCEIKITVNEKFIIFNNELQGFEGQQINIIVALGEKFNYDELMHDHAIPVRAHTRNVKKEEQAAHQNPLFNL